ncbi:bifunctional hydroxymethylpyrimidine kinase/phosphomethylpyrimidine kinase [Bacteroides pyogenes]|uniref:bifunctional hydroxymethylpyrimidine kinase/phosphomethylpyrimidine kinase n=1 Tax=Bacteroides pyogenes TaxID=310300 RepID=UPI001F27F25C|nr:bifunctional hydroxymethylpyrimidine kinase/phosphomethylpyrimidine kinase [Bacteroides pyogenes]MCE9107829.1 bifunctional hydroxymethylpyrimidine kinase/phosphomethylpyrimidine kinase [Bacteroides pyogenes]
MKSHPVILSIAGSDCSGGAGIQADMKTISALGGYAATAITAITVQNTWGVAAVYPVPADVVRGQIEAIMDDLKPSAVKIGMIYDADMVGTIAACLRKYRPAHVVYDPVMVSTSGKRLMTEEAVGKVKQELLPLTTLVTPNLNEAEVLSGETAEGLQEMREVARKLADTYRISVLIKGGHLPGDKACDLLCASGTTFGYEQPKIESRNLHGTGCTLSSAIATYLARGCSLQDSVRQAKDYITRSILAAKELNIGHGNGPLWHFHK